MTSRAAVLALCALAACGRARDDAKAGLGRPLHQGPVRALSASPDGAWLVFLDGCAEHRGL